MSSTGPSPWLPTRRPGLPANLAACPCGRRPRRRRAPTGRSDARRALPPSSSTRCWATSRRLVPNRRSLRGPHGRAEREGAARREGGADPVPRSRTLSDHRRRTWTEPPVILLINGADVRHPRHHRRNHPHPHHQPRTPLPRHRTTPRRPPRTPKNQTDRTLMGVRSVRDVSRHHMERTTGFEPATLTLARSSGGSRTCALVRPVRSCQARFSTPSVACAPVSRQQFNALNTAVRYLRSAHHSTAPYRRNSEPSPRWCVKPTTSGSTTDGPRGSDQRLEGGLGDPALLGVQL